MPRHLAIYTGSFDPISYGHLDILRRSRGMFDEVVLAIGRNPNKEALFSFDERLELARALVADMLAKDTGGAHIRVDHYTGLTVDYARSVAACAIVRGIRNITDLAGECQLAITNRQVAGIETVFIVTGCSSHVSYGCGFARRFSMFAKNNSSSSCRLWLTSILLSKTARSTIRRFTKRSASSGGRVRT